MGNAPFNISGPNFLFQNEMCVLCSPSSLLCLIADVPGAFLHCSGYFEYFKQSSAGPREMPMNKLSRVISFHSTERCLNVAHGKRRSLLVFSKVVYFEPKY